jgi:hypothetical protein
LSLQVRHFFQVHEEDNPRNIQLARTKGAISLRPSGKLQGGFKFVDLNTRKKIVRQSWDVIPIPDLVIDRVNALDSDQSHHMTFTDQHDRLVGDIEITGVDSGEEEDAHFPGVELVIEDDIEIPVVDVERPEARAPQSVEINDPDTPQDNPTPIQVAPTQEVPAPQASAPVTEPAQATGLRRSTRVRFQAKSAYAPSMTGSKYSYEVTQMESQGLLNPDSHVFVQEAFIKPSSMLWLLS